MRSTSNHILMDQYWCLRYLKLTSPRTYKARANVRELTSLLGIVPKRVVDPQVDNYLVKSCYFLSWYDDTVTRKTPVLNTDLFSNWLKWLYSRWIVENVPFQMWRVLFDSVSRRLIGLVLYFSVILARVMKYLPGDNYESAYRVKIHKKFKVSHYLIRFSDLTMYGGCVEVCKCENSLRRWGAACSTGPQRSNLPLAVYGYDCGFQAPLRRVLRLQDTPVLCLDFTHLWSAKRPLAGPIFILR